MKSADFFIDKANEYIKSIDEVLPNLLSPYSQGFDPTPEYRKQSEKISDLRLKTKLLFTEFDNGELFKNKIVGIDENKMLWFKEDELLKQYKHTISLFIDHINEFRK